MALTIQCHTLRTAFFPKRANVCTSRCSLELTSSTVFHGAFSMSANVVYFASLMLIRRPTDVVTVGTKSVRRDRSLKSYLGAPLYTTSATASIMRVVPGYQPKFIVRASLSCSCQAQYAVCSMHVCGAITMYRRMH